MTENSNEENFSFILDAIIKKLTYSDLISVYFLLMENYILPQRYLCIIEKKESDMKDLLKNFFLKHYTSSTEILLIEILITIKRYDLLKILNVCRHKYQDQRSSLNTEWKSLYEVCESFDIEEDLKHFQKAFPSESISNEDYLEVFLVKAYHDALITKAGLSTLLTDLNKDNLKSRTWHLHGDKYFIKQPTTSSPCGLAIIINHENFTCEENDGLSSRKDSLLDVDALKKLWNSFGFEIQTCLDYKEEQILQMFKELSEKDLSNYDVFVTCYMSHGEEGVVFSSDCKPIQISCLVDFMANKCKSLINKPKLFFIQACQGNQIQRGTFCPVYSPQQQIASSSFQPQTTNSSVPFTSNIPIYSDVLVAFSTIPGFASFACKNKNSWFIEALVENMEQIGHQRNFIEVMTKVSYHVKNKMGKYEIQGRCISNCKQTVKTETSFTKNLFLLKVSS